MKGKMEGKETLFILQEMNMRNIVHSKWFKDL